VPLFEGLLLKMFFTMPGKAIPEPALNWPMEIVRPGAPPTAEK
jgi:hypothetical protein